MTLKQSEMTLPFSELDSNSWRQTLGDLVIDKSVKQSGLPNWSIAREHDWGKWDLLL